MNQNQDYKVYAYDRSINNSGENQTYATKRKNDIKKIKKILKQYPNAKIEYYNGWVRINGESFNGFSKEFIKNYCNIAI